MTNTQALPSWDAEMQRQVTATTVAQYRIIELEGQLNALRDILSADSATVAGQTLVEALRAVVAARDEAEQDRDRLGSERATFQVAHRMAERHVAELLLARSDADREVAALTGERDELRRQVDELRRLKAQEVRG